MESRHERHRRVARGYDRWAEAYALRGEATAREWFREPQARFAALLPAGGRVLDVGCGPGLEMADLHRLGLRAVGLDPALEALRLALTRLPDAGGVRGTALALPFATAAFDGIWASASLHHLARDEVPAALAEIQRILRRGGAFYASLQRGQGGGWIRGTAVDADLWYTFFGEGEWRALLAQAGFAIKWSQASAETGNGQATGWVSSLAVAT